MKFRSYSFLKTAPTIIESGVPGPTVMLLGGIHGNETCGVELVKQLMKSPEQLALQKGRVILMYGNLPAIRKGLRQGSHNLNRVFLIDEKLVSSDMRKSYEYKRALQIREYLDQADVLLDLHSVTNTDAVPFLIGSPASLELALHFDVKIACSGLSTLHAGSTDGYMEELGKVGLCLECGSHDDPHALQVAQEGVQSLLRALGMTSLQTSEKKTSPEHITVTMMYQNLYEDFTLAKIFAEFEPIKKGTLVGYDGGVPVYADHDGLMMFARNQERIGSDCFCLAQKNI